MNFIVIFNLFLFSVCAEHEYRETPQFKLTENADGTEGRAAIYDMIMSAVVFRHGDRTPDQEELDKYPSAVLESTIFFPYGKKALTNKGKQRAFRVGQYLRNRYDGLISKLYLPEENSIQTTDYARTKMTVLTVLSALYPPPPIEKWNPNLNWQPIPYDTPQRSDDSLLPFSNCPRYVKLKKDQYSLPDIERYLNGYQDLFRTFSKNTNSNITTLEDVFYLDNLFQALNNVDVPTPQWAKQHMPKIKEMTKIEYMLMFSTDELIRLSTGGLLSDILNATSIKIKGDTEVPKLFIYSAHENNVAAFLAATRVYIPHQPRYGSTVSLELWRNRMSGQYGFMVVYSAEAGGPGVILPVRGCGGGSLCDYDKFLDLTKNYVLPHSEYKKRCSLDYEN